MKITLLSRHILVLAVAFLVTALPSRADTFSFNMSTGGASVSGAFTATKDATTPNAWDITGVTGQVNGISITSLVPGSYNPNSLTTITLPTFYFNFDNLLYTSGPLFDIGGVLFQLANSVYVNLYNDPSLGLTYLDSNNVRLGDATATVATVPEASTLALLGTGALGLFSTIRRRLR